MKSQGSMVVSAAQIRAAVRLSERDRRTKPAREEAERDRSTALHNQPVDPIITMLLVARMDRGWSRGRVSRELSLRLTAKNDNVSERSIQMYETGLRSPSLNRLRHWAAVFGIEIVAKVNASGETS